MVLGEFKRGKSTFINALLGEEVLPSSAIPCTAVINEVKWGEQQRAILHFRYPLPKPLAVTVPPESRRRSGGMRMCRSRRSRCRSGTSIRMSYFRAREGSGGIRRGISLFESGNLLAA